MAIKANFTAGLLSITGDNGDDTIAVSRDAAGQILINGGAISVQGDQPTLVNTTEIDVFGGNGNDTISLDNVAPPQGKRCPPHTCSAATARTPSSAAPATIPSSAAPATTRSLAVKAPTRRSSAPATTRSSGIRATAMTWSRAAAASTRSTSSAPIDQLARHSASIPTAPGRRSTVPTAPSISPMSSAFSSRLRASTPTTSRSTI